MKEFSFQHHRIQPICVNTVDTERGQMQNLTPSHFHIFHNGVTRKHVIEIFGWRETSMQLGFHLSAIIFVQ